MQIVESPKFEAQADDLHSNGYRKIYEDIDNLEKNLPVVSFRKGTRGNEEIVTCKRNNGKYAVWKVNHSSTDNNQGASSGFRIFYMRETSEEIVLLGIYLKSEIEGDNYEVIARELVGQYLKF